MSTRQTPESGLRVDRVAFLREGVTGEIPTDPAWEYHSNNYHTFTWSPEGAGDRQDGLGTSHAVNFHTGNEGHELTVAYDLMRPLVDTNGDPDDPSTDGLLRNEDSEIQHTHAILAREDRQTANPDDPADTQGARTFTIGKGCYPEPEYEGDPEEGTPVPVEITYTCEKVRSYEVLQPDAASAITVESLNSDDIGLDVAIEDEGAATAETITLTEETDADGNFVAANATTTATFDDIDAVEAQADPIGDLDVRIDGGSTLTTINGAIHYADDDQSLEGDRGPPALGAGSNPTTLAYDTYEHFESDIVQRGTEDIAYLLNNITLGVDNGYEQDARGGSVRYRIAEGNTELTLEAEVHGRSHTHIAEGLANDQADVGWEMSRSRVTLSSASITDLPDRDRNADDDSVSYSVTFQPTEQAGAPVVIDNLEG